MLDEADKMLSLGFADQLERIRTSIGDSRVGLFSATDPPGVKEISNVWAKAPTVIRGAKEKRADRKGDEEGELNESGGADSGRPGDEEDGDDANNRISENVIQIVHVCAEHKKLIKLTKHLANVEKLYKEQNQRHKPRVLVFCNRIATVRSVTKQLQEQNRSTTQLHGDLSQLDRDAAVRDFKGGKYSILVATDVAARGLHVKNLAYVVNYDFPSNLETYVHRVGRTGRVSAEGHAYSFLTRAMAPLAAPLIRLLESHRQSIDPNLIKLAESYKIVEQKLKGDGKQGDKQGGVNKDGPKRITLDAADETKGFIASKTFTGAKPGYVFTKGLRGLGFYLDAPKYRRKALAVDRKSVAKGKTAKTTKSTKSKRTGSENGLNAAKTPKKKKMLPGKAWYVTCVCPRGPRFFALTTSLRCHRRLKGRSMMDD